MLARELMTTPVVTLKPDWPLRRAIGVLHRHDITSAPVLDGSGRMVGIVSEMDVMRDAFGPDPRATVRPVEPALDEPPRTVADVMTTRVLSVPENADLEALAELMMSTGVKSVPVTRDGRPAGVVSRRDLIGVLAHSDRRVAADVRRVLGDETAEEPVWRVRVRDGVVHLSARGEVHGVRIAKVLAETVPGVRRVELSADLLATADDRDPTWKAVPR